MERKGFFKLHKKQPYEKMAYCPDCESPLRYKHVGLTKAAPSKVVHIHHCEPCDKEYLLDDIYPHLVYFNPKYNMDGAVSYWHEEQCIIEGIADD